MDEMPPAEVGAWDPLPEPPGTGWRSPPSWPAGWPGIPAKSIEAARLRRGVAGRCLDEAGIEQPADVLSATQKNLLVDLYNPQIHLRARLQAGFVLGRIGDPRFSGRKSAA